MAYCIRKVCGVAGEWRWGGIIMCTEMAGSTILPLNYHVIFSIRTSSSDDEYAFAFVQIDNLNNNLQNIRKKKMYWVHPL